MVSQAAHIPGIFSKEDTLGVTPKHPLWLLRLPCALNCPALGPHGIGQQAPAGRRINTGASHTLFSGPLHPLTPHSASGYSQTDVPPLGCHPASFLCTLKKGSPWNIDLRTPEHHPSSRSADRKKGIFGKRPGSLDRASW